MSLFMILGREEENANGVMGKETPDEGMEQVLVQWLQAVNNQTELKLSQRAERNHQLKNNDFHNK